MSTIAESCSMQIITALNIETKYDDTLTMHYARLDSEMIHTYIQFIKNIA